MSSYQLKMPKFISLLNSLNVNLYYCYCTMVCINHSCSWLVGVAEVNVKHGSKAKVPQFAILQMPKIVWNCPKKTSRKHDVQVTLKYGVKVFDKTDESVRTQKVHMLWSFDVVSVWIFVQNDWLYFWIHVATAFSLMMGFPGNLWVRLTFLLAFCCRGSCFQYRQA